MFSLKDKVALVTGASQGIGRDTALALAEAGAKVAVAARSEEKLSALVADIAAAGGCGLAVKMDVADAEQVKAPTMSRIVAGLKSSGLARIEADANDARRIRVSATAKGEGLLQEARERRIQLLADCGSRICTR